MSGNRFLPIKLSAMDAAYLVRSFTTWNLGGREPVVNCKRLLSKNQAEFGLNPGEKKPGLTARF